MVPAAVVQAVDRDQASRARLYLKQSGEFLMEPLRAALQHQALVAVSVAVVVPNTNVVIFNTVNISLLYDTFYQVLFPKLSV